MLVTLGRTTGVFALSRLVVAAVLGAVLVVNQGLATHHFTGPWPPPPRASPFLQALGSWDGSWYLLIAKYGYFPSAAHAAIAPGSAIAFFPAWPLLLRGVSALTGATPVVIGVALAFVFGAGASVALWYLVRQLCDDAVADRAIVLWVFFPGAVVLSMVYSEALAILLCAVCLLALLRRRWLIAGVAAGVATAVHPEALVLVACCLWAAGAAVWKDRDWWAVLAPVLSLAGVLAFFSYLDHATGDFFRWYHVERTIWGGTGLLPRHGVRPPPGGHPSPRPRSGGAGVGAGVRTGRAGADGPVAATGDHLDLHRRDPVDGLRLRTWSVPAPGCS